VAPAALQPKGKALPSQQMAATLQHSIKGTRSSNAAAQAGDVNSVPAAAQKMPVGASSPGHTLKTCLAFLEPPEDACWKSQSRRAARRSQGRTSKAAPCGGGLHFVALEELAAGFRL
jgi:hypothetical protein